MAPIIDDNDETMDIARISKEDKESIVKEMARSKPDPKTTIEAVFATSVHGLTHPVSPNEEQMFQLFTQAPISNAYNLGGMFQMQYPLDITSCSHAISIMIKRHDVLRSSWHMGESLAPVRRIHNKCGGDVLLMYCDKAQDLALLSAMENQKPHQLGVYAARFAVFGVRNDRRKLASESAPFINVNLHHVIADADGMGSCANELDTICSYLFQGYSEEAIMSKLPEITVQFSDYAYWQLSLEARGILKPDLGVWFSSMVSSYPLLTLDTPLDKPRERTFVAVGDCVKIRMDQELLAPTLEKVATTPYTLVFTLFTVALSRLSRQTKVNVAIAYGTRANPSLYPLIGNFLNMLPATFEYEPSEAFGTVLDRVSQTQLFARKYALAPYLTVVGMLRKFQNPTFDPSRNPIYQAMVDMVPDVQEEAPGALAGVLDVQAFAGAPGGVMKMVELGWNSTLMTRVTGHRMLLQMKAIAYIAAYKASQGAHVLHSSPLPKNLPNIEEGFDAFNSSLGSFPLKIYANSEESGEQDTDCTVNLINGFGFQGTPDEWDFTRRSRKFARHSGVMPTTDVSNPLYGLQYQVPPKPPKKKGQPEINIVLPEVEYMEDYEKPACDTKVEWPAEDAVPVTAESHQLLEGTVESYDDKCGYGVIETSALDDPVLFFRPAVPILRRPTKKTTEGLQGKPVAFTCYKGDGQYYASGLRFLEA